jgi:hypothetical protein
MGAFGRFAQGERQFLPVAAARLRAGVNPHNLLHVIHPTCQELRGSGIISARPT